MMRFGFKVAAVVCGRFHPNRHQIKRHVSKCMWMCVRMCVCFHVHEPYISLEFLHTNRSGCETRSTGIDSCHPAPKSPRPKNTQHTFVYGEV